MSAFFDRLSAAKNYLYDVARGTLDSSYVSDFNRSSVEQWQAQTGMNLAQQRGLAARNAETGHAIGNGNVDEFLNQLGNDIKKDATPAWLQWLMDAWETIKSVFSAVIDKVVDAGKWVWEKMSDMVSSVTSSGSAPNSPTPPNPVPSVDPPVVVPSVPTMPTGLDITIPPLF